MKKREKEDLVTSLYNQSFNFCAVKLEKNGIN